MQSDRYLVFILLLLTALAYATIQAQLPHDVFWSNDGGEKIVQVKSLIQNGWFDPEISYDEKFSLEPEGSFEFAPFYPGHARNINGRLLPVVPIYFPLLSVPFYKTLGHAGLYILPVLCSLLTIYFTCVICNDLLGRRPLLLVVFTIAFGSPIFFYSLTFWEHTLAMSLCMSAIFLIYKASKKVSGGGWTLAAAGMALSAGTSLRGELYIVICAIFVGLVAHRQLRARSFFFAAGVLGGLLPFVLANNYLYGSLTGFQVQIKQIFSSANESGVTANLLKRWDVFSYLILSYVTNLKISIPFFIVGFLPVLYWSRLKAWTSRHSTMLLFWFSCVLVTSIVVFTHLFFLKDPIISSLNMLGLFAVLPILPFAFIAPKKKDATGKTSFLWFLFVVGMMSLAGFCVGLPSRGGLQWGPRYTLTIIPVLAILSVMGFETLREKLGSENFRNIFTMLFTLLIISGICIQGYGISVLVEKKMVSKENISRIEEMNPEVIITDTWWVPEDNAELYSKVPFYTYYSYDKLSKLLVKLYSAGAKSVVLVSGVDNSAVLAGFRGITIRKYSATDHKRLKTFNLFIHKIVFNRATEIRN